MLHGCRVHSGFQLGSDGVYRCDAFEEFQWQRHGFGTRFANPPAEITLRQVHSADVWNARNLSDREAKGDALIGDEIGKSIGVRTADCVPILLLDSKQRAIGAVHAGWRGTAADISVHAVAALMREFKTAARDIYAAIGPCIRSCCYEVSEDVLSRFAALFPEWEAGKHDRMLDLAEANRRQLQAAGVKRDHIFDCDLCTACLGEQFFSYRREPQNPGRMVASISRVA